MNPVRTLGPAVAFWKFGNAFWYCVAQLLGGMAAAFVNEKVCSVSWFFARTSIVYGVLMHARIVV